jgi:hypothetical protein
VIISGGMDDGMDEKGKEGSLLRSKPLFWDVENDYICPKRTSGTHFPPVGGENVCNEREKVNRKLGN